MRRMSAAIQFTGAAKLLKSAVHDHEVSFGHDYSGFVLQCWRDALDETEQTLTTGCDMSAVLDVIGLPILLGSSIVAFVEERVKSLKNEGLIFFPVSWGSSNFTPTHLSATIQSVNLCSCWKVLCYFHLPRSG